MLGREHSGKVWKKFIGNFYFWGITLRILCTFSFTTKKPLACTGQSHKHLTPEVDLQFVATNPACLVELGIVVVLPETTQLTQNWETCLSKSSSTSTTARRTDTAISSLLRTNVASWNSKIRIIISVFVLHQQVINGGKYVLPRNLHIRRYRYHRRHFVFNVTLLIRWPIGQRKLLNKNRTSWIKFWRRAQKLGIFIEQKVLNILSLTE